MLTINNDAGLGRISLLAGHTADARLHLGRALQICSNRLGADHPLTADIATKYASMQPAVAHMIT